MVRHVTGGASKLAEDPAERDLPSSSGRQFRVPHPISYQGSKRRLAPQILALVPGEYERLIEPFAGSGALTLAAAQCEKAHKFLMGDALAPLALLWTSIVNTPSLVAHRYRQVWGEQHESPKEHYLEVRAEFNQTKEPALLLYLLARCVKNAVRFNPRGEFNQSADHRRKGKHPDKMERELARASALLSGRCYVKSGDYRELLVGVKGGDLVYMDPPYQGVSAGRDKRYVAPLLVHEFVEQLDQLNRRGIDYLVSFDGSCGDKVYGPPLPEELGLRHLLLPAGRSSQATLSGRAELTFESLYVSPLLAKRLGDSRTSR
jgi:DNA adenine methylase